MRWLDRYGTNLDEVRAALQWAFGPEGDAALGVELAADSHMFWGELELTSDHRRWVQEARAQAKLGQIPSYSHSLPAYSRSFNCAQKSGFK